MKRDEQERAVLRLKEEDIRAQFDIAYKKFAQSMDRVLPEPKAERLMGDLKWGSVIRQLARSRCTVVDSMDISDCGEKVHQIVHDYIHISAIEVRNPVAILDKNFKNELEKHTLPESKVAEMEHAIKRETSVRMDEDSVFYQSLKEKVEELLERLKAGRTNHYF